jgi:hypothetical protein
MEETMSTKKPCQPHQAGNTPVPAVGNFYRQALRIFMATHPVHLAGPAGEGGSYLHDE